MMQVAFTWMMQCQPFYTRTPCTHQLIGGEETVGEFGQGAGVTPLVFFEGHPGIFNDHRESGPRFNISSEGRPVLTESYPHHYTGALRPTQTTGWAPPAGLINTSSSSNLVFPGGLPSRYWPGSALLSFSGEPVLSSRVYLPRLQSEHINVIWQNS